MFPMLVQEQLDLWPESDLRNRQWVCFENVEILVNFRMQTYLFYFFFVKKSFKLMQT